MTYLLVMNSQTYLRNAICSFIREEIEGVDIVTFETAGDAAQLAAKHAAKVDLILIHGRGDHFDQNYLSDEVRIMRGLFKGVPIVLLGDADDCAGTKKAIEMGANGFIPASTPAEIVKHALPLVAVGGVFLPATDDMRGTSSGGQNGEDGSAKRASPEARYTLSDEIQTPTEHDFTHREVDVLSLLGLGLQNKLIAHELGLKESTVKVHVRHIMKKLKATSRTQAALFAQRRFPVRGTEDGMLNGDNSGRPLN